VIKKSVLALRDLLFTACVSIRNIFKGSNKKIIVGFVASQKTGITGSAKPLFEELLNDDRFVAYWVYPKANEKKLFAEKNYNAYYKRSFYRIGLYVKTDIWITTHGSFGIPINYNKHHSKRIELWHGIPFKGFLKENKDKIVKDFNQASTVVVTSNFFITLFSEKWGVDKEILRDLGQPRTDMLINNILSKDKIKKDLGIKQSKVILYAPTHEQDLKEDKLLFPWNENKTFKTVIDTIGENTALIIRPHPYWKEKISEYIQEKIEHDERIYYMPAKKINNTEKLIYISDVLITDWSSIYFDFLLMKKPTIFLNLQNPFEDQFVMKPEERVGYLASNEKELSEHLHEALNNLSKYYDSFNQKLKKLIEKVYTKTDGKATERCINEIIRLSK